MKDAEYQADCGLQLLEIARHLAYYGRICHATERVPDVVKEVLERMLDRASAPSPPEDVAGLVREIDSLLSGVPATDDFGRASGWDSEAVKAFRRCRAMLESVTSERDRLREDNLGFIDLLAEAERKLAFARGMLLWLNSTGGLGLDVHARIERAIAETSARQSAQAEGEKA